MIRLYFSLLFCVLLSSTQAQTLHAILVSDVEDPELGQISQQDEETILRILKTAEWGTGHQLSTTYFNRSNFTAQAIRDGLNNLQVNPEDITFFYYSGLGFYPHKASDFPSFKLKESTLQAFLSIFQKTTPLSLDEVGETLLAKGGRLSIVMADCRDTLPSEWNIVAAPSIDEDLRKVFLKKLFLEPCGLVKVASARPGQPVLTSPLGFTYNFFETFTAMLDSRFDGIRQAQWNSILAATQNRLTSGLPEETKRTFNQRAIWGVRSCSGPQRFRMTRYPSYTHSMSAGEVGGVIRKFVENEISYEAMRSRIKKAFGKNSSITLIRQNKYPKSDPRAKRMQEHMRLNRYLNYLEADADKIKSLKVDVGTVKRNPNYEYIMGLTLVETWEDKDLKFD